jgi:hypothetical protein
MDTLKYDFIKL